MITEYYIINPTGNITALVTSKIRVEDYKKIASFIMNDHLTVEQVGFVDLSGEEPRLHMAGGEFCGNAAISTAALFCKVKNITNATIHVSLFGADKPVSVKIKGENDRYSCEAVFQKPDHTEKINISLDGQSFELPIVESAGITHIIADKTVSVDIAGKLLKEISDRLNCPAAGVMIYDPDTDTLCPVVYVRECDTLVCENSCVSGSIAVATYLLTKSNKVDLILKQPGGELSVSASDNEPYIRVKAAALIENHFKEEFDYE